MANNDDMKGPSVPYPATIQDVLDQPRSRQEPTAPPVRVKATPGDLVSMAERLARHQGMDLYRDSLRAAGVNMCSMGATSAIVQCLSCHHEWEIPTAAGVSSDSMICPAAGCNRSLLADLRGAPGNP